MELSTRMKYYEGLYQHKFSPLIPVIARLDGRAFHSFCRHMTKPHDEEFHTMMEYTTLHLVNKTGATLGYTQSDEISLLYYSDSFDSKIFFDGKMAKMISTLSAMASVFFNAYATTYPEKFEKANKGNLPTFDCRAASYPLDEVANYFIWREQDAVRNSIQAAAQFYFPHKTLQGLDSKQLQEKLWADKQVNWNDYRYSQKRGTYVRTKRISVPYTADDLAKLPPRHNAHKNPDLCIERKTTIIEEVPVLTTIKNRTGFLVFGEDPIIE